MKSHQVNSLQKLLIALMKVPYKTFNINKGLINQS